VVFVWNLLQAKSSGGNEREPVGDLEKSEIQRPSHDGG